MEILLPNIIAGSVNLFQTLSAKPLRKELHSTAYLSNRKGVFRKVKVVGATGFEPATSWSQTKCSSQAELRSVREGAQYPHNARWAQRIFGSIFEGRNTIRSLNKPSKLQLTDSKKLYLSHFIGILPHGF